MRGMSIALTPRVRGTTIESALVFDTNLPLGRYDQKKEPVWLRSQVRISGENGDTRYVTEQALAASAKPTGMAPATTPSGQSAGGKAVGTAVSEGVSKATRSVPGGRYIPSLGGLFGSSQGTQPKSRPTMLLLVITPALVAPVGRNEPEPGD